ncbi:hypothetical protein [Salinicoccus carnicancri]|uniref:hypothetical protein n=1 Tax=Salinicoccus carnicancri TaxID=558170 RepID=UPI00037012B9
MAEMSNPLYKHYDGKFEKQEQPYPGVQNKMHPVPDCGEESYAVRVGQCEFHDRAGVWYYRRDTDQSVTKESSNFLLEDSSISSSTE